MVSSPVRLPLRRPAFAGRLICLLGLLLLVLSISAGPAGAYSCRTRGPGRTPSAHMTKVDERDCAPTRPLRRTADPISFAFFVGIILAVLLVPVALYKREDSPLE